MASRDGGFAVVADEVRTLASRTRDSSEAIQAVIERLEGNATAEVQAASASRESRRDRTGRFRTGSRLRASPGCAPINC